MMPNPNARSSRLALHWQLVLVLLGKSIGFALSPPGSPSKPSPEDLADLAARLQAQQRVVLFGVVFDKTLVYCVFTGLIAAVVSAVFATCALNNRSAAKGASIDPVASGETNQVRSDESDHVQSEEDLKSAARFDASVRRRRKKEKVLMHASLSADHGGKTFIRSQIDTDMGVIEEAPSEEEGSPTSDITSGYSLERNSSVDKSPDELKLIDDALSGSEDFIFSALSSDERMRLAVAMQESKFRAEDTIIKKGNKGDFFYVIKEGVVAITASDKDYEGKFSRISRKQQNVEGRPQSVLTSPSLWKLLEKPAEEFWRVFEKRRTEIFVVNNTMPELSDSDSEISFEQSLDLTDIMLENDREELSKQSNGRSAQESWSTSQDVAGGGGIVEIGRGVAFGELALLYNCPRMATCTAKTDCILWRVDRRTFRDIMAGAHSPSKFQTQKELAFETLKQVPFMKFMDEVCVRQIADLFLPVTFDRGEVIIRKGEVGNIFYILTSGTVSVSDIGHGDAQRATVSLGPGGWFGERSLQTNEPRAANVTAVSDNVVTLAMSREHFEAKFGKLRDVMAKEERKARLIAIPIFNKSGFDSHELDSLVKASKNVTFHAGQTIATRGEKITPAIYIIESGRIQIFDENRNAVNTLTKGCHFGGETLLPSNASRNFCFSEQHIKATEDTACSMFTIKAITDAIGDLSRLGKPLPPVSKKLDRTMLLGDLKKHRMLGVGSFGKVWLVQHKWKEDRIYALKIMNKRMVLDRGAIDFAMREKNIMASIDHPFIVNLVATFQDENSLYMLQTFIQGGELFSLIQKAWGDSDGISDDDAKFYGACIYESLSHLHKRNILYRDLKPENVLVDQFGYCILIDLGFAKVVLGRTFTLCGSPEYFAPELILGRGYNRGVDHWAFGAVLYEMVVGQTPFKHLGMTEESLFKRIVRGEFAFPDKILHGIDVSQDAQDIIRKLLAKDPMDRMGYLSSTDDEIRRHPWFGGFLEGNKLLNREVKAPWVPDIADPLDASHFQSFSRQEREEERPWDQKPLRETRQSLFRDF